VRCEYPISAGFEHIEQPQAPTSNMIVCTSERVVRPLVETLAGWFEHQLDHG
jgi:hypothetical protein